MNEIIKEISDFNDQEKQELCTFVKDGSVGLVKVKESDIFKWFSLYMADKTYNEIVNITKSDKNLVLYFSNKLNWYGKKIDYYKEVQDKMANKLAATKLKSVDFLSNLINCWTKMYNDKINQAIANNDMAAIENMEVKPLMAYFKSIEMMDKITGISGNSKNNGCAVNINIGNSSEKSDDTAIDITPGKNVEKNVDEFLIALAELKKKHEEKKE